MKRCAFTVTYPLQRRESDAKLGWMSALHYCFQHKGNLRIDW
jgi:hypothetical protein